LITGEHDAKFTALAQEIIGLCPKATHCILKESGHNAHIEQPHAFVQTLKAFFL
jgi:pimeloyl-ACP methyl ester carboxylesterase